MNDTLRGPDLTKGVALSSVADGAMLLGHAHGEPVLQQLVRIAPNEKAILKGSGLALSPVAHQILRWTRIVRHARPLHAGGKSRAAASAQARLLDLGDDRFRGHRQRLLQRATALLAGVRIEGID